MDRVCPGLRDAVLFAVAAETLAEGPAVSAARVKRVPAAHRPSCIAFRFQLARESLEEISAQFDAWAAFRPMDALSIGTLASGAPAIAGWASRR